MVDQLDEQAIRIVEIERSGAVSMLLGLGREVDAARADSSGPYIDILRLTNQETDVMDHLNGTGLVSLGEFVQSEIVCSRRQIGVLLVGHPF